MPIIAGSLKKTRLSGSTRTAQPTAALPRRAAPALWAQRDKAPSPPLACNSIPATWISLPRAAPGRSRAKAARPCWTRPACTAPGVPAGCSATAGQHVPAVCDLGNGACRPDPTGNGFTPVLPSQVHLDPSKRYYISVLPGDAANPFPAYAGQPACPANGAEAPTLANTDNAATP